MQKAPWHDPDYCPHHRNADEPQWGSYTCGYCGRHIVDTAQYLGSVRMPAYELRLVDRLPYIAAFIALLMRFYTADQGVTLADICKFLLDLGVQIKDLITGG